MKLRLITLTLVFLGCTYSLSKESATDLKTSTTQKTYKAPKFITWEEWLKKTIKDRDIKDNLEIVSLTSSGGFHGGGSGNLFLLVEEKTKKGSLLSTGPMHAPRIDKKVSYDSHDLNSDKISVFLKKMESFPSKAYTSRGFDLYRYTWTHYNFSDDKLLRTSKPVSFDDPFIGRSGSIRHQEIINAFKFLKDKPTKNKE
ncbi:MAG: hypothetical protein AB8G05_12380 [Oligoflexales bacterium]